MLEYSRSHLEHIAHEFEKCEALDKKETWATFIIALEGDILYATRALDAVRDAGVIESGHEVLEMLSSEYWTLCFTEAN